MKFVWFELPILAGIIYAAVVIAWWMAGHVNEKIKTMVLPVQFGKTAVFLGILLVLAAGLTLMAGGNDAADALSGMGFYLLLFSGLLLYGAHVRSTVIERLTVRKKSRYLLGYREILELVESREFLSDLLAKGEAGREAGRRTIVRECMESLSRYGRTGEREHLETAYRIIRFVKKWDKGDRKPTG